MKLTHLLLLNVGVTLCATAYPQAEVSASDKWWSYMADYDGKPGSTRLDMGQHDLAPRREFPYVVIAGTKYKSSLSSGLPDQQELQRLHDISDKLVLAILSQGPSVYVGTFIHNGEQLHYVYASDTSGIQSKFMKAAKAVCESCEIVYRERHDPDWNGYLKFLYPNPATLDFYRFDPKQLRGSRP